MKENDKDFVYFISYSNDKIDTMLTLYIQKYQIFIGSKYKFISIIPLRRDSLGTSLRNSIFKLCVYLFLFLKDVMLS